MYENFNIFIKDGRGTRWRGGGLVESTPLTGTIAKYDLLLHTIKKKQILDECNTAPNSVFESELNSLQPFPPNRDHCQIMAQLIEL